MKKLTLCLAVFASMAVQANTDLKSTGYIDIERIKRENPVPQVNIEEQRKIGQLLDSLDTLIISFKKQITRKFLNLRLNV